MMNKSEQINELAKALSQLQGQLRDVHKEKQGFGYKYADLGSMLEIVRPLLSSHNLAISQLCISDSSVVQLEGAFTASTVCIETMLMHESGQYIGSSMRMVVQQMKGMTLAQSMGTVISYARRYMLASILGLTQIDNDAANVEMPVDYKEMQSDPTYKKLVETLNTVKVAPTEQERWLKRAGVTHLWELTNEQMQQLIDMLVKRAADKEVEVLRQKAADEELAKLKALGGIENAV